MNEPHWVVMRLLAFEFEPSHVFGVKVGSALDKIVGYLPVYATRDDALRDFPDGPLVEVREVVRPTGGAR